MQNPFCWKDDGRGIWLWEVTLVLSVSSQSRRKSLKNSKNPREIQENITSTQLNMPVKGTTRGQEFWGIKT